jgi:hypothetical protein
LATALDALCAARGASQPRAKWRYRKAERALGATSPVLARYVELQLAAVSPDCIGEDWLPRCLAFARGVGLQLHFPGAEHVVNPFAPGATAARSIDVFALADRDHGVMAVHRTGKLVTLDEPVALLWYLMPYARDASSLAALYEACRSNVRDIALPALDAEAMRRAQQTLFDAGLATALAFTPPVPRERPLPFRP